MSKEIASALIGSLIPLLISTFFAWLANKNAHSKRKSLIENARQRIELINAYINSQSLVVSDPAELEAIKEAAASELCDIKTFLDHRLQGLQKAAEKSDNYLLRFFLLYRMRSGRARIYRFCFFAGLAVATLIAIIVAEPAFSPSSVQTDGVLLNLFIFMIFTAPGILVAFIFRWLAKKADTP